MLDNLIAEIEKKKGQQTIADQKLVVQHQILGDLAPRLWASFRLSLQEKSKEHLNYFDWQICPKSEAEIRRRNDGKLLHLDYLEDSRCVAYQIGEVVGMCRIGLNETNAAIFLNDDGDPYPGAGFVADKLLEVLLRV
jgi:hypothetical protein